MKRDSDSKAQTSVDAEVGNMLVEVRIGVAALRNIRAGIMHLTYALAERPDKGGFLVLPDVAVTRNRLETEWRLASSVLRPDLLGRLTICIPEGDHFVGIPKNPDAETQRIIADVVAAERSRGGLRPSRADYSFVVLGLLIHQWLRGEGPMTTVSLMDMAGCSYPTVASALRLVGHCLVRHSDRKVELERFPKEEWARMVAVAEKARGTVRFADRSGQPRSAESLLRRLQRLERADIAVGGVVGAKHYHPALDLVGIPRLDLSLHCWRREPNWDFVERLDPGLARVEGRGESASLVVHLVRRKESLFEQGTEGWVFADPVECLLDLHEARLESQAKEFLEALQQKRAKHE